MEFPRYTREENRACKLTDNQIEEIKIRHQKGESYPEIAKDYNVTPQTIFYWCLDEKERKRRQKERQQQVRDTGYLPPNEFNFEEYKKRKKELHPEFVEYENQFTHDYKKENRPNYPILRKLEGQRYWKKYKDKLTEKNKKYQLLHLDKFRKYNKKHREKYHDKVLAQQRESYLRRRDKKLAHDREVYRKKHPIVLRKTKYSDESLGQINKT